MLLLFLVIAVGYALGNITVRGVKLGVAAVLFVGLGFGALDPALAVPDVIIFLGLSIYVYTIGLSSGPGFFRAFKKRGTQYSIFVSVLLLLTAVLTAGIALYFAINGATAAGILAGSVTNTPALAGLLDLIANTEISDRAALSNAAVVGYSLAYPMGVLGVMLAIVLSERWYKIDYAAEARQLEDDYPTAGDISRITVELTEPGVAGTTLRQLFQRFHRRIAFGRMERAGEQLLPNMDTVLRLQDRIVLVGGRHRIEQAGRELGRILDTQLSYDRSSYEVRRLFVSNPAIAGQKIASLNLNEKYTTIITRVQRGDSDLVATGDTVLELGDRVLLVAHRDDIEQLAELFGNSYEALSQINLLSFGLGMGLGLLLGTITFSLPGDFDFQLGYAGGPLLVALALGALRRTGPLVWTLPYSANLTLRQIGLILLLAGVGVRSGHTFLQTLLYGGGGWLLLAGAAIVTLASLLGILIGYKLFRIPFSLLTGMVANQPAVLEFAAERSGNKLPVIGFSLILPVSIIVKIVLVQVLYLVL